MPTTQRDRRLLALPPTSPGGAWAERVLWNFGQTSGDGFNPVGAVVIGAGGGLYGVTAEGGSGVVFELYR